eukprot:6187409-Pleurochrysis_carterae.AAC.4
MQQEEGNDQCTKQGSQRRCQRTSHEACDLTSATDPKSDNRYWRPAILELSMRAQALFVTNLSPRGATARRSYWSMTSTIVALSSWRTEIARCALETRHANLDLAVWCARVVSRNRSGQPAAAAAALAALSHAPPTKKHRLL